MNRMVIFVFVIGAIASLPYGFDRDDGRQRPTPRYIHTICRMPRGANVHRQRFFSGHTSNGLHHWFEGSGKRRIE